MVSGFQPGFQPGFQGVSLPSVTGGRMLVFVPSPEEADAAYARRERDRKRHREKVRAEAQAVITVAMAAVLDHQRQLEEDDWLLGLADDYVRRAA